MDKAKRIRVTKLRTEYLENPLGIDVRRPHLGWQVASERRAVMQSACQVQVARTAAGLEAGRDLIWDSGKVGSDNSISMPYGGPEGRSAERCFWRARVWDQDGAPSDWSEPAWWEMALTNEEDWSGAHWIEVGWDEDPRAFKPCPFFRRGFGLEGPVKSARLYITAHGLYEAWLNGERVGDQVFTPGYTAYDKRLQYQVYDVTALLREGDNVLGAILGDGWYRGRVYIGGDRNAYGTRLGLLALLRVETVDGTVAIGSDAGWTATTGPIIKSDMKDGEIYDARLEMPGWASPGFDDRAWRPVRVAAHPKSHLVASMGVPVRRKETFGPKVIRTPRGETVLDFGQNLSGVVHMKVRGPRGTVVRLRHGEALDEDGNFTVGHLFIPERRDVERTPEFQEVRYTLRGGGEEDYEPRFTVHGFRYARLEGYPGEPRPDDFRAVAIYSDMPPTGSFECSDPMVNQLHHNVQWSMKGNFLDLPTDCPTRERAGWTGDAQIFTPSASFLMDTRAFFRKWLAELRDEQRPDGMVGNFVPDPYRIVRRSPMKMLDGSSGWGDVATIMPWGLYQAFGDPGILAAQYGSMKAWVEYERRRARKPNWAKRLRPRYWLDGRYRARQRLIWDTGYQWGEWLEPGGGSMPALALGFLGRFLFGAPEVATAYFANSARILARTAEVLGNAEDARSYHALADEVQAAYAEEFIGSDGRIRPDRQASYVRVLAFDLAPKELQPAIAGHLVRLVRAAGTHIATGFLSTPFLCHVLADRGHLDLAYDLLEQKTIPSWLYAVSRGATTIWETWEGIDEAGRPRMSLNHYSPGSVVDFLHRKVAGLDAGEPGYRRVAIRPLPGGGLTHAKAACESVHGLVVSEWEKDGGRMLINVTIPANTRATVTLPHAAVGEVTESGVPLARAEGVATRVQAGANSVVEVGSGTYRFEYPVRV